ncbi:MAG: acyltransferase [Nitrospirae bacterium]|nr:acyltransferase [Nitrospirota bacterium]
MKIIPNFLKRLFRKSVRKFLVPLGILLYEVRAEIEKATLPKFGNKPTNLKIDLPRRIANPEEIFLGDNIYIGPGSLLTAIAQYPSPVMRHPDKKHKIQEFKPKIIIGNRVTSTGNLQIAAVQEIIIEDDVMFASNINMTDGLHGYENANEPYKYQNIFRIAPIRIKRGCWIGQNVVILPGVTIGEFSIIGANSVVTKNIPDRCIAVGAPAKVVKKWDDTDQRWIPADD